MKTNKSPVALLWCTIKFGFALSLFYFVLNISFSAYELDCKSENFKSSSLAKYECAVLGLIICGAVFQVLISLLFFCISAIEKIFQVSTIWYSSVTFNTVLTIGYISYDAATYGIKVATGSVLVGEVVLAILFVYCFINIRKHATHLETLRVHESCCVYKSGDITSVSTEVPFLQDGLPTYEQAILEFPKPTDGNEMNDEDLPKYEEVTNLASDEKRNVCDPLPEHFLRLAITMSHTRDPVCRMSGPARSINMSKWVNRM